MASAYPVTRRRRLTRVVLWLALLLVTAYAVDDVKAIGRRERAAAAETQAQEARQRAVWGAQARVIRDLYDAHRRRGPGTGWTRSELEAGLGRALRVNRSHGYGFGGGGESFEYFDDALGEWVEFRFEGDKWADWSIRVPRPVPPPTPQPTLAEEVWLPVRRPFMGYAAATWFALLLAGVTFRASRYGADLIHASLLVAFLLAAAAEAHPGYHWFSRANDYLWVGVALLCVSGVALWFAARRARRVRRELVAAHVCLACGYDCRATPDHCPECGTPAPAC